MLNQHRDHEHSSSNTEILITKDLLGGFSCNSQESSNMNMDFKDLKHPQEIMKLEKGLDLKLESSCWWSGEESQSVCTLEKVKNALERDAAEKERKIIKRPSSSSTTTTATATATGKMFAAGCPVCLLYVITLKTNPKCPRCNSTVSSNSLLFKKPKLDL